MQELTTRLEALCQAKGAEKFSAEEIVELLTDGEEIDWIVEQILPTAAEADRREMDQILGQIAAAVAPAAPDTDDEEPAAVEELDLAELQQSLPPGVDVQQVEEMLRSPQGAMLADFSAFCQERGLEGEPGEAEMRELHEEWLQTPRPRARRGKTGRRAGGWSALSRQGRDFPPRNSQDRAQRPVSLW